MKSGDAARLDALRMVWSAIRNEEINARRELDDTGVLGVIGRQVKQLDDAVKDFATGHRDDLVQKTNAEIELLRTYLPAELSDDELESIVKRVAEAAKPSGPKDLGRAMGLGMKEVGPRPGGRRCVDRKLLSA